MAEGAQAWFQRCGKSLVGKGLALFRSLGQCAFAHSLHALECPTEIWTAGVSFFFFTLKKEPTVIRELVDFGPCVSAETVKARALIGLHTMAEENAFWLGRDLSPDLGDVWRNVCPKSPEWISSGPTSKAYCCFEFYEHNFENMAIEVIGQDSSGNVALFLKDWELGRVALSCHMAMDFLCQEMNDACRESSESLVLLAHCAQIAWKKGEDALMPSFCLSFGGLACRLGTVLNILCRLRNESFLSFRCEPLCFCFFFQKVERRAGTTFSRSF